MNNLRASTQESTCDRGREDEDAGQVETTRKDSLKELASRRAACAGRTGQARAAAASRDGGAVLLSFSCVSTPKLPVINLSGLAAGTL